jgi:Uma2 family endonuclease
MSTVAEPITADELLKMPRGGMRRELIRGELSTMSPAGSEHGVLTMRLSSLVEQYVTTRNLGLVFTAETGFLLERNPDTVRAPDITFVRQERIPASGIPQHYWPGAPDLAVEVVSPNDTVREVDDKVAGWLQAGSLSVWVVSPRWKTVTVYVAGGTITTFSVGDMLDGGDALPGFQCPVSEIFRFHRP